MNDPHADENFPDENFPDEDFPNEVLAHEQLASDKLADEMLRDRLVEQGLREIYASESPGDLSGSILTRAQELDVTESKVSPKEAQGMSRSRKSNGKRTWLLGVVSAASIIILVGLSTSSRFNPRRQEVAARRTAETVRANGGENASVLAQTVDQAAGPHAATFVSDSIVVPSDQAAKAEVSGVVTVDGVSATKLYTLQVPAEEAKLPAIRGIATKSQSDFYYRPPTLPPATKGVSERVESLQRPVAANADGSTSYFERGRYGFAPNGAPRTWDAYQGRDANAGRPMTRRYRGFDGRFEDASGVQEAAGDDAVMIDALVDRKPIMLGFRLKGIASETRELKERIRQGESKQPDGLERDFTRLASELETLRGEYKALADLELGRGRGPGQGGDQYSRIYENPFVVAAGGKAVSTFSIDVDTASFTNTRQYLLSQNQLPPPDAVRLEEFVNYFEYDYQPPTDDKPFAASIEVAACPWKPEHRLVRIGLQGKQVARDKRPASNLVFLVDVSGSMQDSSKLPLVVEGLKQLTHEIGENDKVAIVVYANREGLVLPSTRGHRKQVILDALEKLQAGGSTAGGAGIQLAYQVAKDNFVEQGTNRVILCTDGDFNVGVTSTGDLERMAETQAKSGVFLTVLGFGRGNLNDAMMERVSNRGNGSYHYVDNTQEARKVLVRQMSGTLITIAKDVKIQVEFNPAKVAGYRLLGYENRMLAREDFNDDTKDAGEIGAGHTVTALYEVVPAGSQVNAVDVEPLKYQPNKSDRSAQSASAAKSVNSAIQPVVQADVTSDAEFNEELLELRFRYKQPDGDTSQLLRFAVVDEGKSFSQASDDFHFASAVAGFGMLLRGSQHSGSATYDSILEIATSSATRDEYGYRAGLLSMIRRAKELQVNAAAETKRGQRAGNGF